MDKTLMRPLFRKKAEQLRKIDGKKVPGYVIGGLIPLIRTMAAPTYRYLAPKVGQFFARPGVQTGLTGLETYGIAAGTREAAEGVSEGDAGKVLSGLSLAVPGAAFLPYSARKSGIAALRETGEFLQSKARPGVQLMQQYPGRTALGSIGAGVTGQAFAEDTEAAMKPTEAAMKPPAGMSMQDYKKDVQDRLIYSKPEYSTEIVTEGETPELLKPSRVTGIKNPKTEGEKTLNKQIQDVNKINDVADKLGITDATKMTDKQIKQVAIESNVPEQQVRGYLNKPKTTGQPTPPQQPMNVVAVTEKVTNNIPGMTDTEVENLVKSRKNTLKGAENLSGLSEEFRQFRDQLNEITGSSSGNLNNLIAMKAASALLTGKTREPGVKGFLDIGGQALGASADMMFQLALAQKNQDMELATAFLKSKADKSKGPGFVSGDKTFKIENPNFPGNFYNVKGILGKDGKQYYRDENNEVKPVPRGAVGYEIPQNQDKINLYSANLEENKRAQEMIQEVINILPTEGPLNAAFNLVKEDVYGTLEQVVGKNRLDRTSDFDAEIRALMKKNDGSEKQVKESEALLKKYDEEIDNIDKRALEIYRKAEGKSFLSRPSEEQLRKYAKLALIEQRMKYMIANANKSEDRLTQKDIENAEKNTKIIQFIGSAPKVRQNYLQLQSEFRKKAAADAMKYRNAGGTESSMQYFINTVPGIKEMYDLKKNQIIQQTATQNKLTRDQILSTLPIPGVK